MYTFPDSGKKKPLDDLTNRVRNNLIGWALFFCLLVGLIINEILR